MLSRWSITIQIGAYFHNIFLKSTNNIIIKWNFHFLLRCLIKRGFLFKVKSSSNYLGVFKKEMNYYFVWEWSSMHYCSVRLIHFSVEHNRIIYLIESFKWKHKSDKNRRVSIIRNVEWFISFHFVDLRLEFEWIFLNFSRNSPYGLNWALVPTF